MQALYDTGPQMPGPDRASRLRDGKATIIGGLRRNYVALRERWGGIDDYDRWFSRPLNNAQLNTVATYYRLVPAFARILDRTHGRR